MVIDDNRTNRRILEGLLTSWGMKTTVVSGGEDALALLAEAREPQNSYQLVLTDMHMPKMDGFGLVEKILESGGTPATTIMMLSSAGHRGDAARCQQLGIAAYLLKPVRQTELREAMARALGAKSQSRPAAMITRTSLQEARDPGKFLNVLLAEDNEVNQKLATRLLEKRGHKVVVVSNGRDALLTLEKGSFELVLMDVQMPELDGIEATMALREKEKLTGRHQPILAMTALVMKGDRERCLAAGMDGYLAKPIRAQELDEVLEGYLAQKRNSPVMDIESPGFAQGSVNVDELLERLDGDRAFLAELTEVFRNDYPRQLRGIRDALEANDPAGVRQRSHALKGALSSLAANRARDMAAGLERQGTSGDLAGAETALESLEQEVNWAMDSLAALCQETVR